MANSSLTISFNTTTGSTDKILIIDLDDEKNDDRTTFLFGETVHFRVFTDCDEVLFFPSEGSVSGTGSGTATVEDTITFTEPPESAGGSISNNTASLNYPANEGSFSATVLGSGAGCGTISVDDVDAQQANASQAGPGVYIATYQSDYDSHSIDGPSVPEGWDSDLTYPVVIVVVGT